MGRQRPFSTMYFGGCCSSCTGGGEIGRGVIVVALWGCYSLSHLLSLGINDRPFLGMGKTAPSPYAFCPSCAIHVASCCPTVRVRDRGQMRSGTSSTTWHIDVGVSTDLEQF